MIKPITPTEAKSQAISEVIPDEVFKAANELIVEKYLNDTAVVNKADIIARAQVYMRKTARPEEKDANLNLYNWDNFIKAYEAEGWIVKHQKGISAQYYCDADIKESYTFIYPNNNKED